MSRKPARFSDAYVQIALDGLRAGVVIDHVSLDRWMATKTGAGRAPAEATSRLFAQLVADGHAVLRDGWYRVVEATQTTLEGT